MSDNFYQPPSAPISAAFAGDSGISPLAIQHLVRTQPWVRLVSIFGLIITCIVLLGLLFFPVALGFASGGRAETGFLVTPVVVIGFLYLFPLIKLSKYAAAIRRLRQSRSSADLEDALNQQRSFWKFVGVLTLIGAIGLALQVVLFLMISAQRTGG
jgi:uncharacterized membrane protein